MEGRLLTHLRTVLPSQEEERRDGTGWRTKEQRRELP